MYDPNLADVYLPIFVQIEKAVAEGVADPQERAHDQTPDGTLYRLI